MNDSKEHLKYKVCVVCNVPRSEAPSVMYAKFPNNINRCRKWVRVIGNVNLLQLSLKKIQYRYVCGNHFVKSHFTKSGKYLTKDAVPTILPPNIKPLKKDVVKLFPPLVTRTNNKVLLKCTQRIVPIKKDVRKTVKQEKQEEREVVSPDSTAYDYEYLDSEYIEPLEEEEYKEQRITIKEEALDPAVKDCLPKIIPILHHNLAPNSHTTEIYTINKDRQVVPITSKVLHDGKDCIIELSHKKVPAITRRKPKYIPVSNEVLSSIIKKDRNVKLDLVGFKSDAYQRIHETTQRPILESREAQLQKKVQRLQQRNRRLKKMLKNVAIVEEVESPYIKKLINKAILHKQLNFGVNEFTNEKQLAVSVLKRALNAYHYLSGIIPLPNVCMLQKISMKEPIYNRSMKCKHLL